MRSARKSDKDKKNQLDADPRSLHRRRRQEIAPSRPDTNKPLEPKALGGPEIDSENGQDPRQALFNWMDAPDNPFFARAFVNRVWGHYFGVGIVDPVDNFSLANPPSNPQLLDALAREFVKSKYDIRQLERPILNSRVYQLSSTSTPRNSWTAPTIRTAICDR